MAFQGIGINTTKAIVDFENWGTCSFPTTLKDKHPHIVRANQLGSTNVKSFFKKKKKKRQKENHYHKLKHTKQ